MLTTLLGGDGTIVGGAVESRAQLPLLLAQLVEPVLDTGTISTTVVNGVDVVVSWSSTGAQLPLLLAQRVTVGQTIRTGLIGSGSVHGVDVVGGGSGVIDTGTIQTTVVHGIYLAHGGFLPTTTDAPSIEVSLDLTDPTLSTRTWTDITPWVRSVQITRGGRNHELQRSEAGTMTLTVDNRDGTFDPDNVYSPLWGLRRMQWVRVRALWGSRVFDRATMLIESIRQEWPASGFDATVTLSCTDAMKTLSLFDLQGQVFDPESTGSRVERVAGLVGLEVAAETGQSTLVGVTEFAEGSSALEHLRQVEETENGQLFVDADGVLTFHDRHHRALDFASAGTVGDADGEIPFQFVSLDMDDGAIWNTVRVTTSDGDVREVEDATSGRRYYARRLNRTLLSRDQNEAQACAEYLLLLYADPPGRLPAISLIGQNDTSHWPTILSLGNSDRLTWRIRPITEGGARTIEKNVIVEKVSETIVPNGLWQTVIDVSPADPFDLWVLGDADRGKLGTTTRLGY